MLWFGLNTNALLFVIANAAAWPIAINLSTGFKTVNPTIVAVGRNIGLSSRRLITDVLAPAALPHAISGLKTAWAFGWRTIIAAELVFGVAGADGGLGTPHQQREALPEHPAGLRRPVTIAILMVFEFVFGNLERTIVRWGMEDVARRRWVWRATAYGWRSGPCSCSASARRAAPKGEQRRTDNTPPIAYQFGVGYVPLMIITAAPVGEGVLSLPCRVEASLRRRRSPT